MSVSPQTYRGATFLTFGTHLGLKQSGLISFGFRWLSGAVFTGKC